MRESERTLLPAPQACPLGCTYCFAKSADYLASVNAETRATARDERIVYPTCDGEFLLQRNWETQLNAASEALADGAVLRFSTKTHVTMHQAEVLAKTQRRLEHRGCTLLVGISLTPGHLIPEIEPRTAPHAQRLESLQILRDMEVPVNATLRPILPFAELAAYERLVEDAARFTGWFLLGDLYVFAGSEFARQYIEGRFVVRRRKVRWAPGCPVWQVVESQKMKSAIADHIRIRGGWSYDSDLALVPAMHGGG